MSDDFNPLYNFLPFPSGDVSVEQLNDVLRQIADSLAYLQLQDSGVMREGEPFVPFQFYQTNGVNDAVAAGAVPVDVWNVGGILAWRSTAAAASLVSSDAGDTAAGTGAQVVRVEGVDANFDYVTEDIPLNGLTPVVTTQQFLHTNRIFNILAGSNRINLGTIDCTVGGSLLARIDPGIGQSQNSHILLPNAQQPGKVPHVAKVNVNVGRPAAVAASYALGELLVEPPGAALVAGYSFSVTPDGPLSLELVPFAPIPPGSRVWTRITEAAAGLSNYRVRTSFNVEYLDPPLF